MAANLTVAQDRRFRANRNWFVDQGERTRIICFWLENCCGRMALHDDFLAAWIVSRLGGGESSFQY